MKKLIAIAMAVVLLVVAIPLGGVALASSTGPFAYVANYGSGTVSVIDTSTNTVVDTITVGTGPGGLAITPDGGRAYVPNYGSSTVSVIDTDPSSPTFKTVIATVTGLSAPQKVAITPDGTRAYVTNRNSQSVSVIDTSTNTVGATITTKADNAPVYPNSIAITPDGTRAYVTYINYQWAPYDRILVIDTNPGSPTFNTRVNQISGLGSSPSQIAFTPDGTHAYVTNGGSFWTNHVSVIDTSTETVVATITLDNPTPYYPSPGGLAVTPDGSRVYVANGNNKTISIINTLNNTVIKTITGLGQMPSQIAFTADGSRAYVTDYGHSQVFVIETATNTVVKTIGMSPQTGSSGIAISPLTLAPANQAPVANNQSATTPEDTAVAITLTASDVNVGDTLTFSIVSPPTNGSLSGTPPDVTYTPTLNFNDSDSFTFRAYDGKAYSNTATVTITVNPVNDVPSFTKGADQTVLEDAGAQTVNGWATNISAGPANESGQALNFIVSNDNNGLFSAQPAIAPNGTLTYTPATNANGSATVTVQIHDNGGVNNGGVDTSASQTFTITVTAINDPPLANAGPDQTVDEGTVVTLSGTGSDIDGDVLTFQWIQTAGPPVGLGSPNSATTLFTAPQVDADMVLTFQLMVSDAEVTANDTVNITVRDITPARTIGYWKNHPSHLEAMLTQGPISLGDTTVTTVNAAVAVLSNSSAKDARDALRAQLLAAVLNLRNNANPNATGTDIQPAVSAATNFLATHSSPVDGKHPDRQQALQLKDSLEAFNASGGI